MRGSRYSQTRCELDDSDRQVICKIEKSFVVRRDGFLGKRAWVEWVRKRDGWDGFVWWELVSLMLVKKKRSKREVLGRQGDEIVWWGGLCVAIGHPIFISPSSTATSTHLHA